MVNSEVFSLATEFTMFTRKVSESKKKECGFTNYSFIFVSFPQPTSSLQFIDGKSRAKNISLVYKK